VQLGAAHNSCVARVVLRCVLELLYGQRDKRLMILLQWLLKGGRIRGAYKLISWCVQRFVGGFLEQGRSGEANQQTLLLLLSGASWLPPCTIPPSTLCVL
jgi:hypothetical protein